jgi:hypothetical protein
VHGHGIVAAVPYWWWHLAIQSAQLPLLLMPACMAAQVCVSCGVGARRGDTAWPVVSASSTALLSGPFDAASCGPLGPMVCSVLLLSWGGLLATAAQCDHCRLTVRGWSLFEISANNACI